MTLLDYLLSPVMRRLDRLQEVLMAAIDDLLVESTRQRDVVKSVLALVKSLADKLEAAGTNPAKIAEVLSLMRGNDDDMAAAVVANTPAEPPADPNAPTP